MRIFVSSTYLDLIEHRQAATNALEKLGQEVGRMEIFGALPTEPLEACVKEIDSCDIFVGIYAQRYGHTPAGSPYSITELEFQRAHQQEKPLFCFLLDEKFPWPQDAVEGGEGQLRLLTFKEFLRKSLVVDFFSEPLDLAVKVATAVGRYLIGNPKLLAISPKDRTEQMQREALVALLEARKAKVLIEFDKTPPERERFLQLHELNIDAIRNGELLVSHLLTADIHALIAKAANAPQDALPVSPQPREDLRPRRVPSEFVNLYPYPANSWSERPFDRTKGDLPRGSERKEATSLRRYDGNSLRKSLLYDWLLKEIQVFKTELSDQRRLSEHVIRNNACEICGSTAGAIKRFGFKCV